ncbi:hypothetical protein GIB67_012828 [Kingdonia uniflora]|uniref:Tyrosine-protein kinase catalytic domain-containing protein n=1 Tax=Kingdonia uniflora TaxID=39325 RepID=A0A7J7NFC8_9MAGN|nr:hypothetical protein GIB67_012828 [Kingdonia uniflora]
MEDEVLDQLPHLLVMEDKVIEQTPPLPVMEDHEVLEQMPPTEDILEGFTLVRHTYVGSLVPLHSGTYTGSKDTGMKFTPMVLEICAERKRLARVCLKNLTEIGVIPPDLTAEEIMQMTMIDQTKKAIPVARKFGDSAEYAAVLENKKQTHSSGSVSSGGVWHFIDSLSVYKFEELQKATGYFAEDKRIKGSVFHEVINGDNAAIKRMRGDVSSEINILKQINHCSVIRLSGFCVNKGNTYLVYEFAENGSLSDWLHAKKSQSSCLKWKERVQIAYDSQDCKFWPSENIGQSTRRPALNKACGGYSRLYGSGVYREWGGHSKTRMLELLSGKEAANDAKTGDVLLCASIKQVLEEDNVREELKGFIDASLKREYPLDLAFSMAQLTMNCVDKDLNSRPTMADVFMSLSKILSSSLDWDPLDELGHSMSLD